MAEELKSRKEVPEKLTWDLTKIYQTEEDMYRDADAVKEAAKHIAETWKGRLNTPENIEACVTEYRHLT